MTITPLRTNRAQVTHDHHRSLHAAPPLADTLVADPALSQSPERDMAAAEQAAAAFLDALGVDLSREGLEATPGRMARAYAELLTPRAFEPTTFPNEEGYDELVLAR